MRRPLKVFLRTNKRKEAKMKAEKIFSSAHSRWHCTTEKLVKERMSRLKSPGRSVVEDVVRELMSVNEDIVNQVLEGG